VAILFADTFETGDTRRWTTQDVVGAGSSLAVNSGAAFAGGSGMVAVCDALDLSTARVIYGTGLTSTTSVISISTRVRWTGATIGTPQLYWFGLLDQAQTVRCGFGHGGGAWSIIYRNRAGGQAAVGANFTPSADTWYQMELMVDSGNPDPIYRLWVDGVMTIVETDVTAGTPIVWTVPHLGFSADAYTGTSAQTNHYDNVLVGDTYIGDAALAVTNFPAARGGG
jgi:hypothetical protein